MADLARFDYTGREGRPLTLDGVFGPETQSALRAYQRDHGLAADGIAGPLTLMALADDASAPRLRRTLD